MRDGGDRSDPWSAAPLRLVVVPVEAEEYAESDVVISNVGRGPAINCVFASRSHRDECDRWCYSRAFNVKEGGVRGPMDVGSRHGSVVWELIAPSPGDTVRPRRVLLCSDIFANRYRFSDAERVEVSRHDNPNPPPWAITWRFGA